ncbi:MAG: hypothetical protein QM627_08925 [Luteolibacter sp.]
MFASLHIPDLAIAGALANHVGDRDKPCAILAPASSRVKEDRLPLLALNRAARAAGIRHGWPLNKALIRCPNLKVLPPDPVAEQALLEKLVAFAESLSPDLEITGRDTVTIAIGGCRTSINSQLDTYSGITWARANTPDLACMACRWEPFHRREVSPEELRPLLLSILETTSFPTDVLQVLESWGLGTLGDFLALPRQALAERLGTAASHWQDVLLGRHCRLLRLHRPPESFLQRFDFEEPAVAIEPVLFAIRGLLRTLHSRLATRCVAAGVIELRLILENGSREIRPIRLPEPQLAVEGMLSPLQTWIESLQLPHAIAGLEIDCETATATAAQREWIGRQLPQPGKWAETLAHLEALLGPGRVGIPVYPASHDSRQSGIRPVGIASPDSFYQPDHSIPLARFRPPRQVAVAYELHERFPFPLALLSGPHKGRITERRGPFPVSGHWWDPAKNWQRLEWDIRMADRQLFRLSLEPPDRWQLEGEYP